MEGGLILIKINMNKSISCMNKLDQNIKMKEASDDEEGFIPSQFEIRRRLLREAYESRLGAKPNNKEFIVNYRFSDGFLKKEPSQSHNLPSTCLEEQQNNSTVNEKKKVSSNPFEHPYAYYMRGSDFKLVYNRQSSEPLSMGRDCIRNQVTINLEEKSTSIKQAKTFQLESLQKNADQLLFDSKFESGNLHCAFRKLKTNQYHLFIQNDTNTLGYNQWFYFSIRNAKRKIKYTFKIVNYKKMLDFFRFGQKISLFSLIEASKRHSGWSRAGHHIRFQQSNIRNSSECRLFTLKFQMEFRYDEDYIMLASALPYSYSKLMKDIAQLTDLSTKDESIRFFCGEVSKTICNNSVPEITITAKESQKTDSEKKMIIFLARQHPGETWSSVMAFGIMKYLLSKSEEVRYLLNNFIIKIYPMVNVDGVIYGNFRCDVTGVDLNRRWKEPSKIFHPQIYEIKKKICNYSKRWKIESCFDLHGHSKKYNIFCYACKSNPYTCRILPYLIQSENKIFNFPSCTFGLTRDKENTARASISKIIKSENVLTIESSFYGSKINGERKLFDCEDLYQMSQSILKSLRHFLDKTSLKYLQTQTSIKNNFQTFLQYDQENQQESGSESDPEADQIDFKTKINTIFDKKFQNEAKSFIREGEAIQLHKTQIQFGKLNEEINKQKKIKHGILNFETIKEQIFNQENSTDLTVQVHKKVQRKREKEKEKRIISILKKNEIGFCDEQEDRSQTPKKTNIIFRDKLKHHANNSIHKQGKFSLLDETISNLTNEELEQSMKLKDFKNFKKDESIQEQERAQKFIHKFQKFIPSNIAIKNNKHKMEALQEGLSKENPMDQLKVLLENKKKLEKERIKKSIEQSTDLAERQGKIKNLTQRKSYVVDFKKFKHNQRYKSHTKNIGEQTMSERYNVFEESH